MRRQHQRFSTASIALPLALLGTVALFPPESLGESMAGAGVLILLIALVGWRGVREVTRSSPLLLGVLGIFPLCLLAESPGLAIQPLALVCLAGGLGLGVAALPKDQRGKAALPVALATLGVLVALWAIYQQLWGLDALVLRLESGVRVPDQALLLERAGSGRAFAGFPTPAALGGYLILVLPVTASFCLEGRRAGRLAALAAVSVQLAGLLATVSVTALLAILGAGVIAVLRHRRVRPAIWVGGALLLLLLAATFATRSSEMLGLDRRNHPVRLRLANYSVAVAMIEDHPLVGVGAGNFGEAYPRYRGAGDNESRHVHNLPLELGAELGVPLGLIVASFFFYLFLGPLLRTTREAAPWWRGIDIGLAAFALHNLGDFTAFLPSLLWTAALLRGWVARRDLRGGQQGVGLCGAAALAGLALCVALAGISGLARNTRQTARQAAVEQDHAAAATAARRATRLAPWHPDGWLALAQAELAGADPASPDEALRRAASRVDRAVTLAPTRPFARDLRSRVRLARGDLPGAHADAAAAARLYPHSKEYAAARDRLAQRIERAFGSDVGEAP